MKDHPAIISSDVHETHEICLIETVGMMQPQQFTTVRRHKQRFWKRMTIVLIIQVIDYNRILHGLFRSTTSRCGCIYFN